MAKTELNYTHTFVNQYGYRHYTRHGLKHRIDGPAHVHYSGWCEWYEFGKYVTHRPYNERQNGVMVWDVDNVTGRATLDCPDGFKTWYDKGKVTWPKLR